MKQSQDTLHDVKVILLGKLLCEPNRFLLNGLFSEVFFRRHFIFLLNKKTVGQLSFSGSARSSKGSRSCSGLFFE